ncbi:MAG: hypothetical protein K6G03_00210 [Lachnospiraceae bacterium]|nr:hypothetical protein [Lachnospiraceae bacterium]
MKILKIVYNLIIHNSTDNYEVDVFVFISSIVFLILAFIAMLVFVFRNPDIFKQRRREDRFMFVECILVFILLLLNMLSVISDFIYEGWLDIFSYIEPSVEEILFLIALVQWLVFVDYSLYRSEDHIKRRYKNAIIPVILVLIVDIIQSYYISIRGIENEREYLVMVILHFFKMAVALWYILNAVYLVVKHRKETREPRFLKIEVFIIPYVLSALFRWYDAALLTLGIILTFVLILRRDTYLDKETGFYNRKYLDYRGKYRDRKHYKGGNGILIYAKGHGKEMAEVLKDVSPSDSQIFTLGKDYFLLISEALRSSAVNMAVKTITEAAQTSGEAFTPEIITAKRGKDESASEFAARLLSEKPANEVLGY